MLSGCPSLFTIGYHSGPPASLPGAWGGGAGGLEMGRPGALRHGGDWHRVKEGAVLPLQPAHSSWRGETKPQDNPNLRETFPRQIQPRRERDLVFTKQPQTHGRWWQLQRVRDLAIDERQAKAALSAEMCSCPLRCCWWSWSLSVLYRARAHRFLLGASEPPEW